MLGETLDDAAGEALDKAARLLGLGYPGGPAIEREAAQGNPEAFDFPVAMADDPRLDFSFSGLKTALLYAVRELGDEGAAVRRADLAASFQAAVVGQLVAKLERALDADRWPAVALGGGVAANSLLRERVGAAVRAARLAAEARRPDAVHRQRGDDRLRGAATASRRPTPATWPGTRADRGVGRAVVTLYGRPGCHLCDEAREQLLALTARARFELREVDIESDDRLLAAYLERIPVVEVDGREVSELVLDRDAVRLALHTVDR